MSRLIQRGEAYDFVNTGDEVIYAGTVKTVGYLIGVVINDIAPGEMGALAINGVWEVPKHRNAQFDAGDAVYWNTSGGYATDDDTKVFMGFAWTDAIPSTTEVKVKLLPDVAGGKGPQSTGGGESSGNPVTWEYVDGIGQGVAPEYESDTEYSEDDFVFYVGKFYKRTSTGAGGSGVSPSDPTNGSTYWTEIVLSDDILARIAAGSGVSQSAMESYVASQFAPAGKAAVTYVHGSNYKEGDIVEYNGSYYRAIMNVDGQVATMMNIYPGGANAGAWWEEVEYTPPTPSVFETAFEAAFSQAFNTSFSAAFSTAFSTSFGPAFDTSFSTAFGIPEPFVLGQLYNEGDLVTYNLKVWRRKSGTGATYPSSNSSIWEEVGWDYGNVVVGLLGVPEFQAGHSYSNELVSYYGTFYVANGNLSVDPDIAQTWPTTTFLGYILGQIDGVATSVGTKEAPEFTIGTDYGKNGIVAYNGKYYLANGAASSNPVTQGWSETTLSEWVTTKIGDAVGTKNRAIENAVDGAVTLATNGGAVSISFDTATPNIVHSATLAIGNNFDPAIWGQNIVEFEMIYANAQAATALTWNGSAVTWIEGSATDLTAGRHLLRVRIIPQLDMNVPGAILVEYICALPTTFE